MTLWYMYIKYQYLHITLVLDHQHLMASRILLFVSQEEYWCQYLNDQDIVGI